MGFVIPRAFLFSGDDFPLFPGVSVKHPCVGEILSLKDGVLCEDYYWSYVSALLSDPYDHMVYLDDNGIDYETVTAFDVFILRWNSAQKEYAANRQSYDAQSYSPADIFYDALGFFFGGNRKFGIARIDNQIVIIDENDQNWLLTKEAFLLAVDFIRQINCVQTGDRIKPASGFAKKLLIEDMRIEQNKMRWRKDEPEHTEQIADALSTVFAGGAGTITPMNYREVKIYHLMNAARSIQKQMLVQALMNGMYSGMIKSDKISDKELRWA